MYSALPLTAYLLSQAYEPSTTSASKALVLPCLTKCHFFFLRCRVVVDNVGDHVMPEQSVFCRPDELGWAYVILQTCT